MIFSHVRPKQHVYICTSVYHQTTSVFLFHHPTFLSLWGCMSACVFLFRHTFSVPSSCPTWSFHTHHMYYSGSSLKAPYPFYSHTDPLVSRADGLLYNTHTHTLRESIVLMNTLFKFLRIVLKLRWFKGSQHIWYVLDLPRQIHLLEWMTGPLTQPEWCVRSSRLEDRAIELTRSIDQRETKDKWSLVAIERKSVSDCNLESSLSECINTQSECVGFVSEHTLIFEDFMSPRGQWS